MKLLVPWHMLRNYLNHPLGRRDRLGTLLRIFRWQIGSRMLGVPVAVPFVDGTRLLVRTGMHGATGNVYVGLMEFQDMAFVLHLLGKGDVFIDVGANVGVYSILAASRGAHVLAMEPVPETYEVLLDNIHINRYLEQVEPMNVGVGSQSGELQFSTHSGPTNHVLAEDEATDDAVFMTVGTLDKFTSDTEVTMIKIDVEGFETEVIRGASTVLEHSSLQAVLIELNGLGARYGFNDADIHAQLLGFGFKPACYEPFTRQLNPLELYNNIGNTLYVRSSEGLEKRLADAQPILWEKISI